MTYKAGSYQEQSLIQIMSVRYYLVSDFYKIQRSKFGGWDKGSFNKRKERMGVFLTRIYFLFFYFFEEREPERVGRVFNPAGCLFLEGQAGIGQITLCVLD